MRRSTIIYTTAFVACLALLLPWITSAQGISQLNPWKIISGFITPQTASNGLQIPSLGSSGSPCLKVDAQGKVGTTTCGAGGGTWGSITGTLSNQTDLWSVLDPKLSSSTLALFDKGFFYSTSSGNYWLTQKTTTNLAEGTNLYFTNARVASVINASSSIPQEPGTSYGDLLFWTGSRWGKTATSSLNYSWNNVKDIPAGFADGVDNTGGSSEHTDAGSYVYPSEGDYHSAPYYAATSTTATSTFAGPVKLTANSGYGGNNDSEGLLNLSMGTYTGSALNIQATGAASASQGEIVHIEQTNASHANEILKIESNSTQGGAEDIYISSPVPDVVLCDTTDSSNDCGELEVSSHGEWLFNFRNAADTSFERGVIFTPTRIGGMVGIGTEYDTPFLGAKLTVVGSTTLDLLDLNSAGNTTAGGNLFTVKSDGKVGIGTTNPDSLLSVAGTASFTGLTQTLGTFRASGPVNEFAQGVDRIDIGVQNGSPRIVFENPGYDTWQIDNDFGVFRFYKPNVTHTTYQFSGNDAFTSMLSSGNERIRFHTNGDSYFNGGNLGIATSSPYAKLSVVGETVSQKFTATDTAATSTLPTISVQTALNLFGTFANSLDDLCTAITGGSGLCDGTDNTGGAPAWGTITGTLSSQTDLWSVLDPKLSSTTLALFDKGFFFSTTSALYHLGTIDKGYFFSTTSANYWETQQTARTADDLTNNSIEDLSDVAAMTENYGDLLGWNGTAWTDFATSSLNYSWNNLKDIPAGFSDGTDDGLTAVTADAPLSGSGTSGSHLTIAQATGAANGYLTSTDWTRFDGKLSTSSWATIMAGTTTDALSQGSVNKYWSNTLFDNRLAATGTLPNLYTLSGLASVGSTTGTTTVVGGFRLSSLNCSGLANGGALTVNASGEVVCTADDGGAGANYWATAGSDVFPNAASSVSAPVFRATSTTATSTFSGPATFTQAAGKNLLSIIPGGNIGTVSANIGEGALVVDNTLNTYTPGLYVSSDQASVPSNPLVLIRSTSASYNQGLLWLLGANSNTGGNAFGLRIQDGNPDIEFREADQTAPAGMYELDINNDLFRINGRNSANNSYDTLAWFSRTDAGGPEMGGRFCLGCGFSDYAGFRFNIVATSVPAAPYLTLSTASTTGAIGNVLTVTKDGLLGLSTSTPSAMLSLTGKAGGKLAQWLTSAGTNMLDIANDTATAVLRGTWDFSNAVVKTYQYPAFTWPAGASMATTTTATTTIALSSAYVAEQWKGAECRSGAGTIGYQVKDGAGNKMDYRQATTTTSRFALSANNTFTAGEDRFIDIGPMTAGYISCTFAKIVN